jgi:opacity protein-like surface antigen
MADMKRSLSISILGTALATLPSAGALEWDGFYLNGDVGAVMQQKLSVKSEVTSAPGKMTFSPGVRANLEFGGRISEHFDIGLASGILWNSIDKLEDDSLSSSTLMQVPLFANFTYRLPLKRWVPYAGVGVGGVMTMLDLKTPIGKLNGSDFTFGYQAFVGVRYSLSEKAELGLGYQFLTTSEHDWSDGGVTLKTDGSISHSLVASFSWRF